MPIINPSAFDAASVLIVLAATLGYANHRLFGLPISVGLTAMGAIASLLIVAVDWTFPAIGLSAMVVDFLRDINFHTTLMEGMLSFLLFAGAMHVDWFHLRKSRWHILMLSTLGVVASTIIVGMGFFALASVFGMAIPLIWCFVFGSLISPTDPVAVMGVLKRAAVPPTLQATVAGESLFNDGVGVVVFAILLGVASGHEPFSIRAASLDFVKEAGGGIMLGLAVGWIALKAMKSIDEYAIEVLISLAVVMGGYSLAMALHISGPVAMAVAGLIIGNAGVACSMSDLTRDYLLKFWELIDEILNAVLFLLIGLEVIAVVGQPSLLVLGVAAIPLVVAARAISVGIPLAVLKRKLALGPLALPTLVWGGLRGGISIALALSLPDSPQRASILAATYVVVLFAVIVQGVTIGGLIKRLELQKSES